MFIIVIFREKLFPRVVQTGLEFDYGLRTSDECQHFDEKQVSSLVC